jgi:hypothetical protein
LCFSPTLGLISEKWIYCGAEILKAGILKLSENLKQGRGKFSIY